MNSIRMSVISWLRAAALLVAMAAALAAQESSNPHAFPSGESQTQPGQTVPTQTGVTEEDAIRTVVALVNGKPVSLYTVRELLKRTKPGPHGESAEEKDPDAPIKTALNRAIFEELAYQKAEAEGMAPAPAELDARVKSLKEKMGGEEAFLKALKDQGLDEVRWRASYARRLMIDRILMTKISDVAVSDEELQKEYEKEKASFFRKERVLVTDIVFFLKLDDPASAVFAEGILARVRDGADKNPYHLVPDGTFIVHEMELNAEKHPELYAEAKKLQPGEYSGVIRASDALHILQLKEYVSEKQFTLDEVKGLLLNKLRAEARRKKMQEWEAELKKEASIEITDMNQWKDKL